MQVITIDFETYYDKDYSLTKLTTEEYLNDDRYETIGVSLKVGDEKVRWVTGTHGLIKGWLDQFAWDRALVVSHNANFDMAILAWKFDIYPKAYGCTLSMSRALYPEERRHSLAVMADKLLSTAKGTEVYNMRGKRRTDLGLEEMRRYGEYCKLDTALCYELFTHYLRQGYPKKELKLIDLTVRMYTKPQLALDKAVLRAHLEEVQQRKQELLDSVAVDKKELMSNDKFAQALKDLGVTPPTKESPRTGKVAYAFAKTDKDFLALQDHEDDRVQALVTARLGVKSTIEETRTQRFIGMARRIGMLPAPLRYCAAHTTRWGGTDGINLQNLPSRGANAGAIKRGIVAPEGMVILSCDSSQIEARVLAWLAGQADLVQAFANKQDVYKIMATAIYNKDVEDIEPSERFIGKETVLGCGYGMSHNRFRENLHIKGVDLTEGESRHIVYTYRDTYSNIPKLWGQADRALEAIMKGSTVQLGPEGVLKFCPNKGGFRLPSGLWLTYTDLSVTTNEWGRPQYEYRSRYGSTKLFGAKVIENLCQAIARCIIAEQMLKIEGEYMVALTVHDANLVVVPEKQAGKAAQYVTKCMRWRPDWCQDLPLDCEIEIGRNYGRMKELPI